MKTNKYRQLRNKYTIILGDYAIWLQERQYAKDTIRIECNYTSLYLSWIEQEKVKENEVSYNDLLSYIDHCISKKGSKTFINRKLCSVRKYYEYLLYQGKTKKNPAIGLFIKSKRQPLPANILTPAELKAIYENYQVTDLRSQRNKVMIGLMVYQGVTRDELEKIEANHIKLKAGIVEIPGGKHSNARILPLESVQMLDLQEYLTITRPTIQSKECFYGTGKRPESINREKAKRQLFTSMYGSDNIKHTVLHLMYSLRRTNPRLLNGQQVRQSVITQWLRTTNLRETQYKAGHKHVSSTERYQVNQLDDLQDALNQFHPLK